MALKKIFASFMPVLWLVLNIFLFLPFVIYQGNLEEFDISLRSILTKFFLPALVLFLVLSATGLLLPSKAHQRFVSLLFMAAALVWIQANLLVWKYGALAGQSIDWGKHVWSGGIDSVLWIGLLALAVILAARIYKIAIFGSALLILLQLLSGAYATLQKPAVWQAHASRSRTLNPPPGLFKFSAGQNVIQCVLDGFQSDLFQEILAQNPDKYSKGLDGFTYFEEATGTFPSTQMSVPAMLCGEVYKNDVPTHDFLQWTNQGRTIGNVLFEHGYLVDLVIGPVYTKNARSSTRYSIAVPYGVPESQYERDNAAQLLDYALFRASPQPVKKLIYADQLWLFQRLLGRMRDELRMRLFSHRAFMDDLIQNMSVSRKRASYKYLHLMTLHPPILIDESCAYAPGRPLTWNNRRVQARCALDQFLRFLDKLRSAGIYDSSLIIVNGDHGTAEEIKMLNDPGAAETAPYHESLPRIASLALPFLAVKPPRAQGLLKTSRAAVGLTDLPATVSSLLRLNEEYAGRSVFEVDPSEDRERKFYFYDWYKTNWENEYFDYIDEFSIRGNPRDRNSWRFVQSLRPPRVSFATGMILFGTAQSNRFKRSGWGANHQASEGSPDYNWAVGNSSFLAVSLPKKRAVTMSARLKSYPFRGPQIISVKVDGKEIGTWQLEAPWDVAERKLVIPPDDNRPETSVIEFSFSQHRTSGDGTGSKAVQFLTLAFQPAGE
jgi:hypothetical protein